VNIGPNKEPSYCVCSFGRIILYSLAATDWFDKRPKFLLIFRKPPSASQRPIEEISIHSLGWLPKRANLSTINYSRLGSITVGRAAGGFH